MVATVAALDPATRRRGFLVEVHPELTADIPKPTLKSFLERLFIRNIRTGMLVTPDRTLVVRDRLSSMSFSPDEYHATPLVTQDLLDAAGLGIARRDEGLTRQVLDYVTAVAASWSSFIPDQAISAFLPEVVGELAEADFEVWDGPLDSDDAR